MDYYVGRASSEVVNLRHLRVTHDADGKWTIKVESTLHFCLCKILCYDFRKLTCSLELNVFVDFFGLSVTTKPINFLCLGCSWPGTSL